MSRFIASVLDSKPELVTLIVLLNHFYIVIRPSELHSHTDRLNFFALYNVQTIYYFLNLIGNETNSHVDQFECK